MAALHKSIGHLSAILQGFFTKETGITDRMEQNDIVFSFINENHFREAISHHLFKEVYEKIRDQASA